MSDRRWFWVVKAAVSAALVVYILWWVPWPDMASSLRSAHLGLVALALTLTALIVWLHSVQMKVLFDAAGAPLPMGSVLRVNLATEFYAFFLPGYALAGALRWYRFTQLGAASMTTFAVLFCNRLISITFVALSGVILLALAPRLWEDRLVSGLLILVFLLLLSLLITAFHPRLARAVGRFAERRAGPKPIGRFAGQVARLSETAEILGSLEDRARVAVYGLCLARQALGIMVFYFFGASLSLGLSWIDLGLVRAVAILLTMIPISVAGIGVREGGLIYMLTRFGIAPGPAVTFSLLLLARDLLVRMAGGLVEARSHFTERTAP